MWKRLMLFALVLPFLFGFTIRAVPPTTYVDGSAISQEDKDQMTLRFYQRDSGSTDWGTPIVQTPPGGGDAQHMFPGVLPGQTIDITADALMADGLFSGKMTPSFVWTRPTDTSPPPDNTVVLNDSITWDWPMTLVDGTPITVAEYDTIRVYVRVIDTPIPVPGTSYPLVGQKDYPESQFNLDTDWTGTFPKPGPGETIYLSLSVSLFVGSVQQDGPKSPGVEYTAPFVPANHPTNIQILRP